MNITIEKLGYKLKIIEYTIGDEYIFDKFSLKILPLVHSKESAAFYIEENDTTNKLNEEKLRAKGLKPSPLYGKLQKGHNIRFNNEILNPKDFYLKPIKGRRIIIAGDNAKPDILGEHLKGIDLLVHECTYTQEVYDSLKEKHLHTIARELGIVCQKHGVKNLIANHINPRFETKGKATLDTLYNEIKEHYNGKLFLADDFDRFHLDKVACLLKK